MAGCTSRTGANRPVARFREAIGAYRATGNELYVPHTMSLLATAQHRSGDVTGALETVLTTLENTEATGTRLWDPELHRLKGELLLAQDPGAAPAAEAALRHAIDVARGQRTKSWELRAAASLAQLLARQGRRSEARETLADVYGWFTEGFDTAGRAPNCRPITVTTGISAFANACR